MTDSFPLEFLPKPPATKPLLRFSLDITSLSFDVTEKNQNTTEDQFRTKLIIHTERSENIGTEGSGNPCVECRQRQGGRGTYFRIEENKSAEKPHDFPNLGFVVTPLDVSSYQHKSNGVFRVKNCDSTDYQESDIKILVEERDAKLPQRIVLSIWAK